MPHGAFYIPKGMHLCLCFRASILEAFVNCLCCRFSWENGPFRVLENPCRYSHSGPEYPNTDLAIHTEWLIGLPWSHMNTFVLFFNRAHSWGHKNEALLEKVYVWLDFWTRKMLRIIRPSNTIFVMLPQTVPLPPWAFMTLVVMNICLCSSA